MKLTTDLSLTSWRRAKSSWKSDYAVGNTKPVLVADYIANRFGLSSRSDFQTVHTFSRPSEAWSPDETGNVSSFAADTPRLVGALGTGTREGLLLENTSQNRLPNPAMTGAATGALDSAGSLPASWLFQGMNTSDVTVLSVGAVNGLPSVQLHLQGTPTANDIYIFHCARTDTPATAGQSWGFSTYASLDAGNMNNVSKMRLFGIGWTAGGSFVSGSTGNFTGPDISGALASTPDRFSFLGQLTGASCERLQPALRIDTSGSIDLTLTLSMVQLEEGTQTTSPLPSTVARADETIGLAGLSGTYDVRVEDQNVGTVDLVGETIAPGYWPSAYTSGLIRSILVYPAGTL